MALYYCVVRSRHFEFSDGLDYALALLLISVCGVVLSIIVVENTVVFIIPFT